jgi:hypothetical protein
MRPEGDRFYGRNVLLMVEMWHIFYVCAPNELNVWGIVR